MELLIFHACFPYVISHRLAYKKEYIIITLISRLFIALVSPARIFLVEVNK